MWNRWISMGYLWFIIGLNCFLVFNCLWAIRMERKQNDTARIIHKIAQNSTLLSIFFCIKQCFVWYPVDIEVDKKKNQKSGHLIRLHLLIEFWIFGRQEKSIFDRIFYWNMFCFRPLNGLDEHSSISFVKNQNAFCVLNLDWVWTNSRRSRNRL